MDREVGEVEFDDELVEVEGVEDDGLVGGIEGSERHKGYAFEDVEQASIDGPARCMNIFVCTHMQLCCVFVTAGGKNWWANVCRRCGRLFD
jgi:hypothetical protein